MWNVRMTKIISLLIAAMLVCAAVSPLTPRSAAQEKSEPAKKQIILCLDGVGFSTVEKMRAEGRFRLFREPARMISPFPTLTNVAMSQILQPAGGGEAVGYEDSFFDTERNRMRGGALESLRNGGTFREAFDYRPSAVQTGLGFAAPPLSAYLEALSDIARLRQKARALRGGVFSAYIHATDLAAHAGGERLLRSILARLDDALSDIARESETPVEIIIFSDHGNQFMKYRRAPLKSALRRAGFKIESRVRDARSVVLPQFGLIGCALLFTTEGNERRLAETMAATRGVDFAAYETEGVVYVIARSGEASIERRGERYRYRSEQGDPLRLAATARDLAARGKADQDGFTADADWFAETVESGRPDALRRVYEGTTNAVRHRANVIVSFEDGYYSGSVALDLLTLLKATHGNLGRGQSFGFVMSTTRSLPAYLRAAEVWDAIGSPVLNKLNASSASVHRARAATAR